MSNITAITAESLITSNEIIARPLIFLEDGNFARITTQSAASSPKGTLHLSGQTLSAGFLDIHVHGAGGHDVMEGTPQGISTVARMLAKHGTTDFLATTVTAPIDVTLRGLEGIANSIESDPADGAARPIGIHLEGPFLSHSKRGVHPPDLLQPASTELFDRFYQAGRGHIRLMTVAPELPGAIDLIAHARSKGVVVSLGHSNALASEARAGITAGAASATHTFNAMRPFDHREPGILGVVLDESGLYAELICDGIHTTPEAVRLWFRSKGVERSILVTDGMAATGMPDGRYKLGGLDVDVANGSCYSSGVLAGSVLTMDRAVENLQRFTGVDLSTAVLLATRNPATLIQTKTCAKVKVGAEANLNFFAASGAYAGTILRGALLH